MTTKEIRMTTKELKQRANRLTKRFGEHGHVVGPVYTNGVWSIAAWGCGAIVYGFHSRTEHEALTRLVRKLEMILRKRIEADTKALL